MSVPIEFTGCPKYYQTTSIVKHELELAKKTEDKHLNNEGNYRNSRFRSGKTLLQTAKSETKCNAENFKQSRLQVY